MYCTYCGKPLPLHARVCPSCGKPMSVTISTAGDDIYAGFGRRFLAWLIDRTVVMLPLVPIFALTQDAQGGKDALNSALLVWLALASLYYPLMECSPWQGTIGKVALDLKVVSLDGERIGFFRALWRFVASFFSSFFFNIGYLIAAFTSKRQTIHDMLAACLVVRRRFSADEVKTGGPAENKGGLVIVLVCVAAAAVPLIGILAAIAIPAYQDYVTRARVHTAYDLGKQASDSVTIFIIQRNALPATLVEAGFTGTSAYVDEVQLDPRDGSIRIVMNPVQIKGKALILTPLRDKDGAITWRCAGEDLPEKYVPKVCRTTNEQ